jgi:hypothetical protein
VPERPIGQVSKTLVPFGNASSNLAPSADIMTTQFIGQLSAVINLIAIIPYVYAVIRGDAKPSRVTWLIWSFLSWVLLLASLQSGAQSTSFWLMSAAFNSTLIAGLSFWKGAWENDMLEISCLVLGLFGVVLWILTSRAEISVYIGSLVDIIAITPTVRKVWKEPISEPKVAWTIGIVAAILNIFAIDSQRFVILFPPICVLFWHLLVVLPIYFRKVRE